MLNFDIERFLFLFGWIGRSWLDRWWRRSRTMPSDARKLVQSFAPRECFR
jgi:hypothetical protein